MKKYFYLIGLLFIVQHVSAQKVVDKVINNDDRKKVEQARKLYNQYKIFEGEKVLKELIRQHPKDVYFYEALAQMQRQVLYRITDATGELQQMNVAKSGIDSSDVIDETDVENTPQTVNKPAETKEIMESLGLDMSKINVKENTKNTKEKSEDPFFNADNASEEPTDATVTIDSSLIFSDEERAQFAKESKGSVQKIDKKTQRKLKIIESFAQIPYDQYLYSLIQHARNATRLFINADSCSYYLRHFLIDTVNVNENVSNDAWAEYSTGLDDYYEKIIPAAAKHFENAIALQADFYTAHIRLGDIYYLMNKDTASIQQYKLASMIFPQRPEPFEKLAIMQYNRGRYTDAAATIIEAIMKYPQSHYIALLKRIVEKTGRAFDPQWQPREVYPLSVTHMQEEIVVNDKSPWWHYQSARQDVFNYYDTSGIVVPNDKTQERYLEVYAWKKMLTNASSKYFQFARAMEKIGYLDCYVLITLFHHDLYGQFNDFITLNDDKVKKYFYLLINWEDEKFDKLRKSVEVPSTQTTKESGKKKENLKDEKKK